MVYTRSGNHNGEISIEDYTNYFMNYRGTVRGDKLNPPSPAHFRSLQDALIKKIQHNKKLKMSAAYHQSLLDLLVHVTTTGDTTIIVYGRERIKHN